MKMSEMMMGLVKAFGFQIGIITVFFLFALVVVAAGYGIDGWLVKRIKENRPTYLHGFNGVSVGAENISISIKNGDLHVDKYEPTK